MEKKYVENFLDFLQNDKKLSDNTLQSYNRDIKLYCNYFYSTMRKKRIKRSISVFAAGGNNRKF